MKYKMKVLRSSGQDVPETTSVGVPMTDKIDSHLHSMNGNSKNNFKKFKSVIKVIGSNVTDANNQLKNVEISPKPITRPARKTTHNVRKEFKQNNLTSTKMAATTTTTSINFLHKRLDDSVINKDRQMLTATNKERRSVTLITDEGEHRRIQDCHNDNNFVDIVEDSSNNTNVAEEVVNCEADDDDENNIKVKLSVAEFRISQYKIVVQHLQNRLETLVTELSELKEKQIKDEKYFNDELDARNCKIRQLETENEEMLKDLSKKIVKVENGATIHNTSQQLHDMDERILGY